MIKYIANFKAVVFDPKNRIATRQNFSCSVVLYENSYSNKTEAQDIAAFHAWCKASSYFWDSHLLPLSIKLEHIGEVKNYDTHMQE